MPRTPKADDLYPAVAPSGHFNPHLADVEYGALDGLVGYAVRRAQLHIYEDFVRSLQTWHITPPRFSAMTVIAHNPNLKLTELANILGVARSGAVLLVDTLEDMGMVERQPSPKDKRAFRLVLTAKGATTLDDITRAVTAHDARVTAHLSTDERYTLLALLNKLASGPDSVS
ncbi:MULTISPECIES: MarR family winged helix-turn-helix transcriptional regulator [Ralstonia]|uniref:MarR family winged helix-turn-helix transcriptional regulator n=1 Tax=Ralstonia TaxID=48736 RepID=UPI0015FAEB9D|nr:MULTISPECIES: MarR family transcriptional regulator [Ralstonia]MBB0025576.1 MarR family transcriptional regulator [Ralstonia pickettii]MBB0036204.1 MarR family transcriptional regulator [Ralstonia pickettii]MBB0098904.1 MarR family transcriptional regulator [Ralstonia pickettii]MBB0108739.1 MarR family transcriptional regulator [Ralstonia pickettii]MBB0129678.1 MarR family transcriptional regulator [Ralstonia pickettii]